MIRMVMAVPALCGLARGYAFREKPALQLRSELQCGTQGPCLIIMGLSQRLALAIYKDALGISAMPRGGRKLINAPTNLAIRNWGGL